MSAFDVELMTVSITKSNNVDGFIYYFRSRHDLWIT